jgi:hypothetical protein
LRREKWFEKRLRFRRQEQPAAPFLTLASSTRTKAAAFWVEQTEQLRTKRLERGQVGNLGEVSSADELLVHHAHLDLELLLFLEELLEDLRDTGGVFAANDDGRWASQRGFELRQAQRLGSDAERAVFDDVELSLLDARRLRSSAASATVTFEKLVRMT